MRASTSRALAAGLVKRAHGTELANARVGPRSRPGPTPLLASPTPLLASRAPPRPAESHRARPSPTAPGRVPPLGGVFPPPLVRASPAGPRCLPPKCPARHGRADERPRGRRRQTPSVPPALLARATRLARFTPCSRVQPRSSL